MEAFAEALAKPLGQGFGGTGEQVEVPSRAFGSAVGIHSVSIEDHGVVAIT